MNKWFIGVLALGCFGITYHIYDPKDYPIFPKCPLLLLTGIKCPGCGSQRAIHSLLHSDLTNAFKYNMLLITSLPYIGALLYSESHKVKHPSLYHQLNNTKLVWGYLIIIIIWWIIRNIYNI